MQKTRQAVYAAFAVALAFAIGIVLNGITLGWGELAFPFLIAFLLSLAYKFSLGEDLILSILGGALGQLLQWLLYFVESKKETLGGVLQGAFLVFALALAGALLAFAITTKRTRRR